MKIRRSAVNDWEVEVRFQGVSVEQDGPFLFWEVVADHPSHCPLFRWCGTREEAMRLYDGLVAHLEARK